MRLKFKDDYTPQAKDAKPFKKDQVVEFDDSTEQGRASAQHFLSRGLAVDMDAETEDNEEGTPKSKRDKEAAIKAAAAKADADKAEAKPAQGLVPNAPQKG